jgi:hypothetical protein
MREHVTISFNAEQLDEILEVVAGLSRAINEVASSVGYGLVKISENMPSPQTDNYLEIDSVGEALEKIAKALKGDVDP